MNLDDASDGHKTLSIKNILDTYAKGRATNLEIKHNVLSQYKQDGTASYKDSIVRISLDNIQRSINQP